jgi:integrase
MEVNRPAQKRRIPSVLTKDVSEHEVSTLFQFLDSDMRLLAQLLYGTGMRLMEGLRLRIKDVDFDRHVIIVREAKGNKDRAVMLPRSLAPRLRQQLGACPQRLGARPASTTKRGADPACAGAEIPEGGQHLGLVLVVSFAHTVD